MTLKKTFVSKPNAPQVYFELVEELADSLNQNGQLALLEEAIATTAFVRVGDYKLSDQPDTFGYLGLNLEESLTTALVKRGVDINAYKLRKAISVDGKGSYLLTKEKNHSREHANAHYVLVGTLSPIESGATLTAKVVDFRSGNILSAATVYFPYHSQFERKVNSIDGQLYRNEG